MDSPTLTGSMRIALANLQLEHLTVFYIGKQSLLVGAGGNGSSRSPGYDQEVGSSNLSGRATTILVLSSADAPG